MRAACAIVLAVALPVALVSACAESAQGPLVGASDAWTRAPEPTSAPSAKTPDGAWQGYGEVLRLPAVNAAPFVSRGHQPEQQVNVRVNDTARAAYSALVTDTVFADGAMLAEVSPSGSGKAYVMRKNAGVWSYLQLDERGIEQASGSPALCVGCHAQAPADHVFGLPRGL